MIGDINGTMSTSAIPSVAVVVPVYREELHPAEELSLRHLETFLGGRDRIFISPSGLRPPRSGYGILHFPAPYFRSIAGYSQLLLSPLFYRAFASYDYLLIYQLDALVFSDSVDRWCRAGYDYLGAPWLEDPADPAKGFSRVGNGGFSLRRVEACLEVLEAKGPRDDEGTLGSWLRLLRTPLPDVAPQEMGKRLRIVRQATRGASWYARHYTLNEDHFWSDRARLFHPGFRIAPPSVAVDFSFERAPRYCFERNGNRLPFGCHAWERWDPAFWAPHLLTRREIA